MFRGSKQQLKLLTRSVHVNQWNNRCRCLFPPVQWTKPKLGTFPTTTSCFSPKSLDANAFLRLWPEELALAGSRLRSPLRTRPGPTRTSFTSWILSVAQFPRPLSLPPLKLFISVLNSPSTTHTSATSGTPSCPTLGPNAPIMPSCTC